MRFKNVAMEKTCQQRRRNRGSTETKQPVAFNVPFEPEVANNNDDKKKTTPDTGKCFWPRDIITTLK